MLTLTLRSALGLMDFLSCVKILLSPLLLLFTLFFSSALTRRYFTAGSVTRQELRTTHCTSPDCTTFDPPVVLDAVNTSSVFLRTDMEIGSDGFPFHVWQKTDQDMTVVHCTNVACSSLDAPFSLGLNPTYTPAPVSSLRRPVLEIGSDNLPIFAYWSNTNSYIYVVHCTTLSCSTYTVASILTGSYGMDLIISALGLPLLFVGSTTDFGVVACNNVDCSSHSPKQVLDTVGPFSVAAITVN